MKLDKYLIISLILAFIVRLLPINFPVFDADDARIAARGYTLANFQKDELGRGLPFIFNSSDDYQLPLTSYITAIGIGIFGKNELGARLPFIIIGTLVVWLTYLISSTFSYKFSLLSSLLVGFSPTLIYISKFPNEWIVFIFLLQLLFINLIKSKLNLPLIFIMVLLLFSLTKIAWLILTPFVTLTLFAYQANLSNKRKFIITGCCLLSTILIFLFFLKIPQSKRSLIENNFPIFSDITIKNGIDRLRGQGVEAGWPLILEKAFFSKLNYIFVGFLHWLSNLSPAHFFGQFDKSGQFGFISMGAWSKILIIPFLLGLINLVKGQDKKLQFFGVYVILLTLPIIFIYPKNLPGLVLTTLPFMALIIAEGFIHIKKKLSILVILLMIIEVLVNIFYLTPDIKNTNNLRPYWVKEIVSEGYSISTKHQVAFSDDISENIVDFFKWYTPFNFNPDYSDINFPYKFQSFKIGAIRIIGNDDTFYNCGLDQPTVIFASNRDLNKIKNEFKFKVTKTLLDSLGKKVAYELEPSICIK